MILFFRRTAGWYGIAWPAIVDIVGMGNRRVDGEIFYLVAEWMETLDFLTILSIRISRILIENTREIRDFLENWIIHIFLKTRFGQRYMEIYKILDFLENPLIKIF